jgi:hypothetical protein
VCDFHAIKCIKTPHLDDEFFKARAINIGLDYLNSKHFVMHLDGDIALPPMTKSILDSLPLQKDSIYGCDRFMVRSASDWFNYISEPDLTHEFGVFTHADVFDIGVRM